MREEADLIQKLSEQFNLPCSPAMRGSLQTFVSRLMEWNARINLTGAKTGSDLVGEHLVDSFAMSHFLSGNSSFVDVGSGGGLPGIPLAILRPDIRLSLVEPRAKRAAFLRTIVHELGLRNVTVHRCRSEELALAPFDFCASRATFPPEEWLSVGRQLLAPCGHILVFANEPWRPLSIEARLVRSADYVTASGRGRWLGAFCFT